MLSTDREEFETLLARLCAAYDRPMGEARTSAYWTGLAHMTLIDFGRVVEHCLGERGPEKFPTVHACWEFARMLKPVRALGAMATAKRDDDGEDAWLIRGNLHLLRYIRRHVAARAGRYGHVIGRDRISICGTPSREMHERVQCLVEAKNSWVLGMTSGESHEPEAQQAMWNDLMQTAESRIDALIAGTLALTA